MRWIFLTLLMANLAYFGQAWYERSQAVPVVTEEAQPAVRKGARLHLLSELEHAQLIEAKPRAAHERSAEPASASVDELDSQSEEQRVCTAVGPFNALDTAESLRQRLFALGVDSVVEEVRAPKAPDYWVYLDPLEGRREALREVRRLHKERVDSYVIGEGDLANGISLGLFSQRASAEKISGQAGELGYSPKIKVVERFEVRYWVQLAPETSELLADSVWRELKGRFGFAERRSHLCP